MSKVTHLYFKYRITYQSIAPHLLRETLSYINIITISDARIVFLFFCTLCVIHANFERKGLKAFKEDYTSQIISVCNINRQC